MLYFFLCLTAYYLARKMNADKIVEQQIHYTSKTVSEVYTVWGVNYLQIPTQKHWPPNSYAKDSLVYSKMNNIKDEFSIKLSLPNRTFVNYWMDDILNPGYFIFLSGILPSLLFYFKNRNKHNVT